MFPYGRRTLELDVPEEQIEAIIPPPAHNIHDLSDEDTVKAEQNIVRQALASTIGTPPLGELVKGKRRVTIISSDHTRPTPSHITMPILLNEIRATEPNVEITILIATGLHRMTTPKEIEAKYGAEIAHNERIVVHDCTDASHLRQIGTLPSGGKLELSTYALDADLLIAEGFIEPHFFAGFSGGRKSVLPGIASYDCVVANHCAEFIADPKATTGNLSGNPIHADMLYAAKAAKLSFILNVIIDDSHRIINAVAGEVDAAHTEGCVWLEKIARREAASAPIVFTSNGGYPMDQNLYQMVKCMSAAEQSCTTGGVIVAIGECEDGVGGDDFFADFRNHKATELLEIFARRGRDETVRDQWQSQILARIMAKFRVILVSSIKRNIVESMGLRFVENPNKALSLAREMVGCADAKVTIIPDGVAVIVAEAHGEAAGRAKDRK
jgi:nickel-dependent lactate racemase